MSVKDFLVEIGTEELPPKALKQLAAAFLQGVESGLQEKQLNYSSATAYASPRRLAVLVKELKEYQPDSRLQILGPPVSAAFNAQGEPSPAAEGFARKCNTRVDQLQQVDTGKGGIKLAFQSEQKGLATTLLLPGIVQHSIDRLPIPKRMRWGSSRIEFVRPTHWLLMLFGDAVVDCEILGQQSARFSYGHRFHHYQPIQIDTPGDYRERLRNPGYVIVDLEERRASIEKQVQKIAANVNGRAVIDTDLLDEVTALVEWPVALIGRFDEEFLRLPDQALISSMKEHQKYFHLVNANNELMPHFITLCNIESKDPAQVIAGNERVIRPRLSDAAFFFDTDRKTPLANRLESLKNIVFQSKLGSLHEKSERIAILAGKLAEQIQGNQNHAERAGLLCKADLVTLMVGEFPNLQGLMGQQYAHHDNEHDSVANAIFEHYLPRYSGDSLPDSLEGCAVSIADKLDTMAGLFAIGQPPTGDKDPFGLRRAALGILRINIEKQLELDLLACIKSAIATYQDLDIPNDLADTIFDFMLDRFRAWFQDEGIPTNIFQAVYARRPTQPLDFQRRIYAVNHFSKLADADALAAANKRVSNILAKQETESLTTEVSAHLLSEESEQHLATLVTEKAQMIAPMLLNRDYSAVLECLSDLRPAVDQFFDSVMVMADNDAIRLNRLALLQKLRALFFEVADISFLQTS